MKIYIVRTSYPESWVCKTFFKSLKEAKTYLFNRCNPEGKKSPDDIEDCGMINKYGTFYGIQELSSEDER